VKIGIDFDNTIINYHHVFHSLACEFSYISVDTPKDKEQVKQAIIAHYGNDLHWQELQSIAYGKAIFQAEAFDGVLVALESLKKQGHELFIVSHKSVASHYDPTVHLREYALDWLTKSLIVNETLIHDTSLFFLDNLEDKISTITNLDLDIFIDDLDLVILHPNFPKKTIAIGFGENKLSTAERCHDWQQCLQTCLVISRLGINETQSWFSFEKGFPLTAKALTRHGNNQIVEVVSQRSKKYILKRYFSSEFDCRNRGKTEFEALKLFCEHEISNTPYPYVFDNLNQYAFYQYIEGSNQVSVEHSVESAKAITQFITQLKNIHQTADTLVMDQASDARNTLADYFDKIQSRLKLIEIGCEQNLALTDVEIFIKGDFCLFKQQVFTHARQKIKQFSLSEKQVFSSQSKTLSPSDLGPHNMLKSGADDFSFIDFEYFGLDDACKMIADLFHHAQRRLSEKSKWSIYHEYLAHIGGNEEFVKRFDIVIDLIGLEWILIVLNIAAPGTIERRVFANNHLDVEQLISERLALATNMLQGFKGIADKSGQYLTINCQSE